MEEVLPESLAAHGPWRQVVADLVDLCLDLDVFLRVLVHAYQELEVILIPMVDELAFNLEQPRRYLVRLEDQRLVAQLVELKHPMASQAA